MSAAGVAYLIAKQMDEANIKSCELAVIGNVGDMMSAGDLRALSARPET